MVAKGDRRNLTLDLCQRMRRQRGDPGLSQVRGMTQVTRNAQKGKTLMVVVHVRWKRRDEDLVIVRLADWKEALENDS